MAEKELTRKQKKLLKKLRKLRYKSYGVGNQIIEVQSELTSQGILWWEHHKEDYND